MFYPRNIEDKLGFNDIRARLAQLCVSEMGRERVAEMTVSVLPQFVSLLQRQLAEMMASVSADEEFPASGYHDLREALKRIRIEGTYLEVAEMWELKRSLDTFAILHDTFTRSAGEGDSQPAYPTLAQLTQGLTPQTSLSKAIARIIDKYGNVKDSASPDLAAIRAELARIEGSIGSTLSGILRQAQASGLVEQGAQPTVRDGRLVIPVSPALKRKIPGIVHDESATGKTVYIEPTQVVEANNRIRELQADERREIIRIMQQFTDELRPQGTLLLQVYTFLGIADFIHAKALMAIEQQAVTLQPSDRPVIDWAVARHPLLVASLRKHGKQVVPLDITLTDEQRILMISGPNAGGKSVCLKTVGLLQYMLQCGLAIPVAESSCAGIFNHIMIDIGDEQSIENELSTYSSHLLNMKNMLRQCDARTLLLIDEFGGGTEPTIGGAIAQAILMRFVARKSWGVITTHFQNLKEYSEATPGIVNGAMLYDRSNMRPLFTLSVGRPGSSFAVEIARKIGLPDEVIADASDIVGQDYINADKYLQDIMRDKRYWEQKRAEIHAHEKRLVEENERLQREIAELRDQRKEILSRAKEQAENILSESNARIEATIKDIREAQAEKERTKEVRSELQQFKDKIQDTHDDELIERKMRQIEARQKRKSERRERASQSAVNSVLAALVKNKTAPAPVVPKAGDHVRIKGQDIVGRVESIKGNNAVVLFGVMRINAKLDNLTVANDGASAGSSTSTVSAKPDRLATTSATSAGTPKSAGFQYLNAINISSSTRDAIETRQANFRPEIDLRGMRGDEALRAVEAFIDDAAMLSVGRVRLLHGTGSGILRTLIRQYLAKQPIVKHFADEHVQFGGAGITVVEL